MTMTALTAEKGLTVVTTVTVETVERPVTALKIKTAESHGNSDSCDS